MYCLDENTVRYESSSPSENFSSQQLYKNLHLLDGKLNRWGEVTIPASSAEREQVLVLSLQLIRNINSRLTANELAFGANNLFDVYPDKTKRSSFNGIFQHSGYSRSDLMAVTSILV